MSFPLYDRLSKNINDKDLTIKQKKFFLETIKTVDSNSKELFYVLIKYDSIQNNLPSMNIPFEGTKKINSTNSIDITWNLSNIPNKLKQVLLNFLKIHVKNINEEKERNLDIF
jgi:hypothetical protein